MLIVPAKNVTLVAGPGGNNGYAESEHYRLPELANYVEVAIMIHSMYATGTASPLLAVDARGSQDGVNFYSEVGPANISTIGTHSLRGAMYSAFVEFSWTFNMSGGGVSDFCVVTFDVHAKFTDVRK